MEIIINGKKEATGENISLTELLEGKKIRPEVVTVELNGQIIKRDDYNKTAVKANDKLEFVYYMGGGSTHFVRSPLMRRTILSERIK